MTVFTQELIFGLVGGLGLFLFGLFLMGQGFQKIAGDRIRRFLERTKSPLPAAVTGILLTVVLQDGAAAVVLVVSLLNFGLIRLKQALCMLFGINLGITVIVHLISFRLEHYHLLAVAVGFLLYYFGRKRFTRYLGYSILGFGLVFTGLNTLLTVMKPLADDLLVQGVVSRFSRWPLWGYLSGAVATFLVQNSPATIGLLQILAGQPVMKGGLCLSLLPLSATLPFLFGTNLGICTTATLASLKANIQTKRAVLAQWIFNLVTAFFCLLLVDPFSRLVRAVVRGLWVFTGWIGEFFFLIPAKLLPQEIYLLSREIAVAHTIYNLLILIVWLPLLNPLVKIVERLLPARRPEDELGETGFLNERMFDAPPLALRLATKEILKMADLTLDMLGLAQTVFTKGDPSFIREVQQKEDVVDSYQERITHYLSNLLSRSILTAAQSQYLAGLFHVVNDVERIADHACNITRCAGEKIKEKLPFSTLAISELELLYDKVTALCQKSFLALKEDDPEEARQVLEREEAVDRLKEEMRQNHINRLNQGKCWPASGILYMEIISNLERIADHAANIAQVVLRKKRGV